MPLIAIIGAGPGLGLEIARAFGRKGFDVALVARDQSKLDVLAGSSVAKASTLVDSPRMSASPARSGAHSWRSGKRLVRSTSSSSRRQTGPWNRSTPWT